MKVRVFTPPWDPESRRFDDSEVQAFFEERRAVALYEHFAVVDGLPTLVLIVTWRGDAVPARVRAPPPRQPEVDPTRDLSPEDRARYERIRQWRNQMARRLSKPPYLLLTNAQAAVIAARRPASVADLSDVEGLGASRIEEFGAELLAVLALPDAPAADG